MTAGTPPSATRLDELEAEARYARHRYDLYKARTYSLRPTSPTRLRELKRECERAESALEFAKSQARQGGEPAP